MYSVLLKFLSQFFKNNLSRFFYRISSAAWILSKMVFCLSTNCKMHWRKQVETNTVYALVNRCWTLCVQWPKTEHRGINIILIYLHKMFIHTLQIYCIYCMSWLLYPRPASKWRNPESHVCTVWWCYGTYFSGGFHMPCHTFELHGQWVGLQRTVHTLLQCKFAKIANIRMYIYTYILQKCIPSFHAS